MAILAVVLHHASDPWALLGDAKRVTRGRILVLEDTPRTFADRLYARFHVHGFNRVNGIDPHGHTFVDGEWRELFRCVGLAVADSRGLARGERWPPVARTLFVLEPGRARAA